MLAAQVEAERDAQRRFVRVVDEFPYTVATPWIERMVWAPDSALWTLDGMPSRRLWTCVAWAYVPRPIPLLRWARSQQRQVVKGARALRSLSDRDLRL